MKTIKALTLSLGEMNKAIITGYQLGLLLYKIYQQKTFRGEAITLKKELAESADFKKYRNKLVNDGVLATYAGLPNNVYTLLGQTRLAPEEVACAVDPFAYVSHLSAMAYHGLTDRIPMKLFLSTPDKTDWKNYAQLKMQKDLQQDFESYKKNGLPLLNRIELHKLGKTEIHTFHSKHLGAYKNIRGKEMRVSTIGRTFLDMLQTPNLCGGINHVLQVYDEYAEKYLRLIANEIDAHGKAIDKVRAGYIINERLGIKDETVESWAQYAQRGGSRKLDASAEYIPEWSEKWKLSLNIFEKVKQ